MRGRLGRMRRRRRRSTASLRTGTIRIGPEERPGIPVAVTAVVSLEPRRVSRGRRRGIPRGRHRETSTPSAARGVVGGCVVVTETDSFTRAVRLTYLILESVFGVSTSTLVRVFVRSKKYIYRQIGFLYDSDSTCPNLWRSPAVSGVRFSKSG